MRIRIVRPAHGESDGINLRVLQTGLSYDVSPALAVHLVSTRCAELIASLEPVLLVTLTDARAASTAAPARREGAGDTPRRNPESILSFESE